jgi:hypothetical protein
MPSHDISEIVYTAVGAAPLLGVYVTGLVLAATHRRQAPRAAAFVFAGVGLMTFALVAQRLVYMGLPRLLLQGSWTHEELRWAFTITGFLFASISAVGTLLLILAAFTGRRRPPD